MKKIEKKEESEADISRHPFVKDDAITPESAEDGDWDEEDDGEEYEEDEEDEEDDSDKNDEDDADQPPLRTVRGPFLESADCRNEPGQEEIDFKDFPLKWYVVFVNVFLPFIIVLSLTQFAKLVTNFSIVFSGISSHAVFQPCPWHI